MYIWSLKNLKTQLLGPGLSSRQDLAYLLVVLTCVSAAFVSVPTHNIWSAVYGVTVVGSVLTGVITGYRCNGGASGQDFLSRFLSVTVVCSARWVVMFVAPLTVLAVVIPGTPWVLFLPGAAERPPMGRYDVIMIALMVPPLFWRIAVQMRDLRRRSRSPGIFEEPQGGDGLEPLED